MNAALIYCNNEFEKAHEQTRKNKAIFDAFEALATEIKKLDYMDQINLYSVTTQFLESMVNQGDVINPLEVFVLRSNSIVDGNNSGIQVAALALGIIAISLSIVVLSIAAGVGVGILLGLWQTPMMFMASLFAAEVAPVIVASASCVAGIGAGLLSRYLFFRESGVKGALNHCVEAVKQSHLSTRPESANDEGLEPSRENIPEL